jgi:hypothetical protein
MGFSKNVESVLHAERFWPQGSSRRQAVIHSRLFPLEFRKVHPGGAVSAVANLS